MRSWARRRAQGARRAPDHPHAFGAWGERQAWRHLKSRGAKLLQENFRAPGGGEADLVVRDGTVLAFVEVKTRRGVEHGRPMAAIDERKHRLIQRAARTWLRMLGKVGREVSWRIDAVEVLVDADGRVSELRWNKGLEAPGRR